MIKLYDVQIHLFGKLIILSKSKDSSILPQGTKHILSSLRPKPHLLNCNYCCTRLHGCVCCFFSLLEEDLSTNPSTSPNTDQASIVLIQKYKHLLQKIVIVFVSVGQRYNFVIDIGRLGGSHTGAIGTEQLAIGDKQ